VEMGPAEVGPAGELTMGAEEQVAATARTWSCLRRRRRLSAGATPARDGDGRLREM
jgi:hypothetical protein